LCGLGWMLRLIPVGRPLPDIADHVVKPVAVRWIGPNRRRSLVSVAGGTLPGELSLPRVRHVAIARKKLITPRVIGAVEAAARGKFPLSFGGERLAFPYCKRFCVAERHMNDGVLIETVDRSAWSTRMAPVGAARPVPPVADIVKI